jgi:hypothetical protein
MNWDVMYHPRGQYTVDRMWASTPAGQIEAARWRGGYEQRQFYPSHGRRVVGVSTF